MQTLENKVATYKLIARDALRMELINPRLSKVASLETELKETNDHIAELEFEVKVETYELSKLDTEHPNYDKRKTRKDETIKSLTTHIEEVKKGIVEIEKQIAEEKAEIAKIESGKTKVCLESLNCLVDKMITQYAKDQVPTVQ